MSGLIVTQPPPNQITAVEPIGTRPHGGFTQLFLDIFELFELKIGEVEFALHNTSTHQNLTGKCFDGIVVIAAEKLSMVFCIRLYPVHDFMT